MIIDSSWKNIASGHTAFCIFGGPSSKEIVNCEEVIKNNFTITVNHNIKLYPDVDMYFTADNAIVREYFEDKKFFLHKFEGGTLLSDKSSFRIEKNPTWIDGKRNILLKNKNLVKVIACNEFPCYNYSFSTGQMYINYGLEYSNVVPNTYLCIEYRSPDGLSWPVLSPTIQETINSYGENPLKFYPGGNISSIVFQLLWFMGFDKVIVSGYGDIGTSIGYDKTTIRNGVPVDYKDDKIQFLWSEEEIHGMVVHYMKWGDRLKYLHGSELCKQYVNIKQASYDELETSPIKKMDLINKLIKL